MKEYFGGKAGPQKRQFFKSYATSRGAQPLLVPLHQGARPLHPQTASSEGRCVSVVSERKKSQGLFQDQRHCAHVKGYCSGKARLPEACKCLGFYLVVIRNKSGKGEGSSSLCLLTFKYTAAAIRHTQSPRCQAFLGI